MLSCNPLAPFPVSKIAISGDFIKSPRHIQGAFHGCGSAKLNRTRVSHNPARRRARKEIAGTLEKTRQSSEPRNEAAFGSSNRHFQQFEKMAEGEGFEPPEACASTVFKTAAIDHSATPPQKMCGHVSSRRRTCCGETENALILHYRGGEIQAAIHDVPNTWKTF